MCAVSSAQDELCTGNKIFLRSNNEVSMKLTLAIGKYSIFLLHQRHLHSRLSVTGSLSFIQKPFTVDAFM